MNVGQDQFRAALLDPAQPVPEGLTDGAGAPAGRRYSVYRNNVAVSLTEALIEGFPVVTKLLGAVNMKGLAGLYLRRHPPTSPILMLYGDSFPDFVATVAQVAHLGYLADVARIDLALRHSYHAADADAVDPAALAALPPEALVAARLTLAPALRLIRSPWPIHAIWRFNTEDGAPKPEPGGQDVAVLRPGFDPEPHLLPPGGAACIAALMSGATLGEAHDAGVTETPEFDLSQVLSILLAGGAICDIHK